MTTMIPNPQIDLAFKYVRYTNKNIFLTGKAGTGKTTFLQKIKADDFKRMAIVAPTGVAAINAGGMTIHSLFQLPFGPIVPTQREEQLRQRKFSREKIKLIKSLDLLIIDEISMVRADVLDAIDAVLRRYRDRRLAFGGVQLLMVGDLHQLPPVVRREDQKILGSHYQTMYFFGSHALRQTDPVQIELKHIYRQADDKFIRLLNKVRNNQLDDEVLHLLNSRYRPDFKPKDEEGYITLTSHNAGAKTINAEKLKALTGRSYFYEAEVEGDFPEKAYPTEAKLEFKIGAQVMFVKNDSSPEKLYYNGKIGRIKAIDKECITVRCPGDGFDIMVTPVEWQNVKYKLDEKTKEVTENIIGAFRQIPLKTAWAITIHKSQGLTFERAIIDAQAAFAHGQVYVALSRCKSFEGIVLRSEIGTSSVRTDRVVRQYTEEAHRREPDEKHLEQSKRAYQQRLLEELFDFQYVLGQASALQRVFLENESKIQGDGAQQLSLLIQDLKTKVVSVAQKFANHLPYYIAQEDLPETNEELQDRLQKAAAYFLKPLKTALLPALQSLAYDSDNQAVKKLMLEKLEQFQKSLFIKIVCFESIQKGFSAAAYLRAKSNADLDFKMAKTKLPKVKKPVVKVAHPLLNEMLSQWRKKVAGDLDIPVYRVLPNKPMYGIIAALPSNPTFLKAIHGMGRKRIKDYGESIIDLVDTYCEAKEVPREARNQFKA